MYTGPRAWSKDAQLFKDGVDIVIEISVDE